MNPIAKQTFVVDADQLPGLVKDLIAEVYGLNEGEYIRIDLIEDMESVVSDMQFYHNYDKSNQQDMAICQKHYTILNWFVENDFPTSFYIHT